jgi:hypothetical protein
VKDIGSSCQSAARKSHLHTGRVRLGSEQALDGTSGRLVVSTCCRGPRCCEASTGICGGFTDTHFEFS